MNKHLLNSHLKISTDNLDEVRERVPLFLGPHKVTLFRNTSNFHATFSNMAISESSISYFDYRAETQVEVDEFSHHYLIEIPLSGHAETYFRKKTIPSQKGKSVVLSPGTDFQSCWTADCCKLLVKLERKALERQLSWMLDDALNEPVIFNPAMDLNAPKGASWWNLVKYIVSENENSLSDLIRVDPKYYEQMLIGSILYNQQNNYTDRLTNRKNDILPHSVRIAEKYLEEHCKDPITTKELSQLTGVSVRSLYDGFQKYRGISPMKLLTNIRFEKVYQALKNSNRNSSVSEIAMDWGFNQLGYFSIEYKRRFGESPSDTLRN